MSVARMIVGIIDRRRPVTTVPTFISGPPGTRPGWPVDRFGPCLLRSSVRAFLLLALDSELGREERRRVLVLRVGRDPCSRALFDRLAQVHHVHTITDVRDDGQVVADEDKREVELVAQVAEQ